MRFPIAILCPLALHAAACSGGPQPASFDSSLSQARIDAIAKAPEGDPAVERALVETLDSCDDAVRMLAITELEARTGETRGYAFEAARVEREAAVLEWVDAVRVEERP